MLRDSAVDLIALRCGNRSDLDTTIINEMVLVQEMLLEQNGRFTPWFMLSEYETASTIAGEERVSLPTEFIAEAEEHEPQIYNADETRWVPLGKFAYSDMSHEQTVDERGFPEKYAIVGNYIILRAIPDDTYTLRFRYIKKQATLSSNVENNWLKYASDLVIAVTTQRVAGEYLQNPVIEEKAAGQAALAWDRLWRMHEAREHTNRSYTMGGE